MNALKSLSPPSQLVVRQAQQINAQALLAINPPDADWREMLPVTGSWHLHAGWFRAWQNLGDQHLFGTTPPAGEFDGALLWLPKEKKLTDYLLHQLASVLPAGTPIWLVGENRSGIKSIAKQLNQHFSAVQKVANGNHSTLVVTTITEPRASCQLDDYRHEFEPPGALPKIVTYPGVFSYPGIDLGSTKLLAHLPNFKSGSVLDFACGNGVLGAALQMQQPQLKMTYLDVSAMALAACAATLELNELDGQLIAEDHLASRLPKYDYIISHPPFHTGQATDYSIGQQFLRHAREHLTHGGEIWLVANRFLPWPELIEASFGECERVAADTKFAIYRAVNKPASQRNKGRRK
ncbi:Ribosomal RNA small subunit methyltransferase C [Pseudidiomarina piscicola]|uniref:Ribosomal RNA small subunit methyltransferase C n=1 Tax=Pseudidiomarina piscicola TaxID=2614830 RepID=A0A6S6WQ50_9GAMM|nr:class I SAM-dependent methyltransferase [Pseudidiomarina piscicola]CAB0151097.1 Ribosomal RNA small subunit methyltransferase C [Pseudidiomarina piscicola]VZT40605.1 Ribosomal RNA small subunit methyltransferase C [Pseudomonas aeruginosa]